MSQLKTNSITNIGNTGDANITLHSNGSTSIRNLRNLSPNILINGAMRVHQRSNTNQEINIARNGDTFVADRFFFSNSTGTAVANGSVREDVPGMPAGFSKCLRYQVTTVEAAIAANEFAGLRQRIEGNNFVQTSFGTAAAKSVSLSFWVRCSKAGKFSGTLRSANGISHVFEYTIATADTWQYITATFPGYTANPWYPNNAADENGHGAEVFWSVGHGSGFDQTVASGWLATGGGLGTSGCETILDTVNATFHITGTMLTVSDSPIEYQHESYTTTLAKCQRYFHMVNLLGFTAASTGLNDGFRGRFPLVTTMRATPTFLYSSGSHLMQPGGNTPTKLSFSWRTPESVQLAFDYTGGWNSATFQENLFYTVNAEF